MSESLGTVWQLTVPTHENDLMTLKALTTTSRVLYSLSKIWGQQFFPPLRAINTEEYRPSLSRLRCQHIMHTLWRLLIRMQWELFAQNSLKEGAIRRQTALFRSVRRPTKFRCRLEALAEIGASFFEMFCLTDSS